MFIMEQLHKRLKVTKQSTVEDIAASIRDISESVKSISNSYKELLTVNKAVVLYVQSIKKRQEDTSCDEIEADLKQTTIAEEQ